MYLGLVITVTSAFYLIICLLWCMGMPDLLGHDGGAFFSGGVPFFLGNFAWGCQIFRGAKFAMTPAHSLPPPRACGLGMRAQHSEHQH